MVPLYCGHRAPIKPLFSEDWGWEGLTTKDDFQDLECFLNTVGSRHGAWDIIRPKSIIQIALSIVQLHQIVQLVP